jgi:hypothetical protein
MKERRTWTAEEKDAAGIPVAADGRSHVCVEESTSAIGGMVWIDVTGFDWNMRQHLVASFAKGHGDVAEAVRKFHRTYWGGSN